MHLLQFNRRKIHIAFQGESAVGQEIAVGVVFINNGVFRDINLKVLFNQKILSLVVFGVGVDAVVD